MPRVLVYSILALLIFLHAATLGILTEQHSALLQEGRQQQLFILPSPILKVMALDYKGIVSDFIFMKGMVYVGGLIQQSGGGTDFQMNESQGREFYNIMDISTDLDPYFQDPYYLANAFLTWDAGLVKEANILLDKGSRYREWDWSLPFFAGFNYFYFLDDNENAAKWLMDASRRPGASPTLTSLASKMAFKANKTESSISLLEEMMVKTDDQSMKELFEKRVEAFKTILVLEKAAENYKKKFRTKPPDIEGLVKKRIIAEIPKEPYGGRFYIDAAGNVRTTSESKLMPFKK
jgi:hypothetical protein